MVLLLPASKNLSSMDARSSSPIGIPNLKSFNAKEIDIEDGYEEYLNAEKNTIKSPFRPINKQIMRLKSEEVAGAPPKDAKEDVSNSPPSPVIPDCSPTFAAVLDEISPTLKSPLRAGLENIKWQDLTSEINTEIETPTTKTQELSPLIQRREINHVHKPPARVRIQSASNKSATNSGPRVRSWSLNAKRNMKTTQNTQEPSSTHSTPALSRRKKKTTQPHIIQPKYVFKNESLSVSHDDIVRQQEMDEIFINGDITPKSIFELNLHKLKFNEDEFE